MSSEAHVNPSVMLHMPACCSILESSLSLPYKYHDQNSVNYTIV